MFTKLKRFRASHDIVSPPPSKAEEKQATVTSPYRVLDRSKNEIRFLRILPLVHDNCSGPALDVRNDKVRCELVYHNFDEFCAKAKVENACTVSKKDQVRYHGSFTGERVQYLQQRFEHHKQDLKSLVTCEDWNKSTEESLRTEWLQTWLWVDTSATEEKTPVSGYVALSYVWSLTPRVSEDEARMFKLRRILKDGSPTCAELLGKIVPEKSDTDMFDIQSKTIILDNVPFKVGCNLENALRALRETPEVQSGLLVWADALCINQNDILERNTEVMRMGSIYRNANKVAIALTEATDRDASTLEFMNFVGESMKKLDMLEGKGQATAWLSRFNFTEVIEMEVKLSQLPYWTRTWIIQETALAPKSSFIICGNRRFLWANIIDFTSKFNELKGLEFSLGNLLLHSAESTPHLVHDFVRFNIYMRCLKDASRHVHVRDQVPKEQAMSEWFGSLFLRLASLSQCKDPRDRVYGLMSLFPKEIATKLKPQYDVVNTPQMVMAELVKAHIEETGRLFMLQIATDISATVDEWPSWVPNFSMASQDFTLTWHVKNGHLPYNHWAAKPEPYYAYGSRKIANVQWGPSVSFGVPTLSCGGVKLDVVSEVAIDDQAEVFQVTRLKGLLHGKSAEDDAKLLDVIRYLLKNGSRLEVGWLAWMIKDIVSSQLERRTMPTPIAVAKSGTHKYGSDSELKQAVESCFTAVGWTPNPGRDDVTSIFEVPRTSKADLKRAEQAGLNAERRLQFKFSDMCDRASKLDLWGQGLRIFFTSDSNQKPYVHKTKGHMLTPLHCPRRKERGNLFTTAGGYVGATLDRLWPGDEVWVLFGLPMPAVLGRCPSGMRLVGKVYVHGVMYGEGLEERESSMVCIS
ncbi:heterokaryon incompatibility protein-domain-containing protein [Paraphoma chrysanthemicola]|uniref:Heterokaryon incompatibility protein-domain-containing protein n=1 Tax=Paraphoma chrysanthemicola TaxID=798071 RepID=A0A8K0W2A1_9PLEO|nr:heterokaryon incompatibility protein-domain-containing protein [Paraphoma chrysanthemicola]